MRKSEKEILAHLLTIEQMLFTLNPEIDIDKVNNLLEKNRQRITRIMLGIDD